MQVAQLPFVDEHAALIAAPSNDVWSALVQTVERTFTQPGAAHYARAVGCTPAAASGPRPLAEGSTFPGFRVALVVAEKTLVLEGQHHFSNYSLHFELEPVDANTTRLRATTRAEVPGKLGRVYRLLVIDSRFHVFAMRRMLNAVGRVHVPAR
jgi:hypothetical protein